MVVVSVLVLTKLGDMGLPTRAVVAVAVVGLIIRMQQQQAMVVMA